MKKSFSCIAFFLSLFIFCSCAYSQPYADEIASFRKTDSLHPPINNPIVFTGSSSIRKWVTLSQDFAGYPVINRGFGGSTLPDLIHYTDELIFKYSPGQLFIYCGENDLASGKEITAFIVYDRFKILFGMIRKRLPQTRINFISIKPSPSRMSIQPAVIEANKLIRSYLETQNNTAYIDVYGPMLNPDGSMRGELFVEDNLHMNVKGYALWQKIIQPYLYRK